MNPWQIASIAFIGGIVFVILVYGLVQWLKTAWNIAKSLEATLREAVKIAKAFEEDFRTMRQFLGTIQPDVNVSPSGSEAEDVQQPDRPYVPFPAPIFDRFKQKEEEKDAESETGDVTGNETDVIEADRIEKMREAGFPVVIPIADPPGRTVEAP